MNFVTVRTFGLPTDLVVAKGVLEANGIKCQTKDELTVQVDNFLSHAIGGVKLQVREKDVLLANQLLNEGGFIEGKAAEPNRIENFFSSHTIQKTLLRLGKWVILPIILVFLGSIVYKQITFSFSNYLPENVWHLEYVKLDDEHYYRPIQSFSAAVIMGFEYYGEDIKFDKNGLVYFPIFHQSEIENNINGLTNMYIKQDGKPEGTHTKWEWNEKTQKLTLTCQKPSKLSLYQSGVHELQKRQNLSDSATQVILDKFDEKMEKGILKFPEYTLIDELLPLELEIQKNGSSLKLISDQATISLLRKKN